MHFLLLVPLYYYVISFFFQFKYGNQTKENSIFCLMHVMKQETQINGSSPTF